MITTYKQLEYYFNLHIQQERRIWKELQGKLYQKYLDQGYNMWFAEVKAEREVLELRSLPPQQRDIK